MWKIVPLFGNYSYSNLSRLRNNKTDKILTPKRGFFTVRLCGTSHYLSSNQLTRDLFPNEWIKQLDEDEVFTPVRGFESYFITSKGRVWSSYSHCFLKHRKWSKPNQTYYYQVRLPGGPQFVHTLVGRHFLPHTGGNILHKEETLSYPEINYVSNLWVGTQSDNLKDCVSKGRHSNWHPWLFVCSVL